MMDKKIKLVLSYDGSIYHGWQIQQNAFTLQAVVEDRLEKMLGVPVRVFASGRTDAGVHALEQVAHFTTSSPMDPETLCKGLNALLPEDILVKQASYVSADFHARYSVRTKAYEYRILNADAPDIFQRNYLWHIRRRLDIGKMRRCLSTLVGCHDFSSFKSAGSENRNPVRTIHRAELFSGNDGLIRITIEADGFLRHMVRNIVGTLVEVGRGKMTATRFVEILESGDRRLAGPKAPARGLFLVTVNY
jgi:tRNA pseudouridine38-40 synthase